MLAGLLAFAGRPGSKRTLKVTGSMLGREQAALMGALDLAGVRVAQRGASPWPMDLVSGVLPRNLRLVAPSSSQEVSALLLALALEKGTQLEVEGPIPSYPYVRMTLGLLSDLGAQWQLDQPSRQRWLATCVRPLARPLGTGPIHFSIEADASAAAVAFAAGLLAGRPVRVTGLPRNSCQGDLRMLSILRGAGAQVIEQAPGSWMVAGGLERGLDLDLSDTPDLAPPLVALAAALAGGCWGEPQPSHFAGLRTLQGKESPRLSVLTQGLNRLGLPATHDQDSLSVPVGDVGPGPLELNPVGDHRMAFAWGLISLWLPSIRVADRECVAKSWPNFWSALERMRPAR